MYKGTGKRGHIVADTLLLMMFLGLRKLGNICCGHIFFRTKSETFFVSRTQNLCPQQMLRVRANRETFVLATICPQQCVLVCQYLKKSLTIRIWKVGYIKGWALGKLAAYVRMFLSTCRLNYFCGKFFLKKFFRFRRFCLPLKTATVIVKPLYEIFQIVIWCCSFLTIPEKKFNL